VSQPAIGTFEVVPEFRASPAGLCIRPHIDARADPVTLAVVVGAPEHHGDGWSRDRYHRSGHPDLGSLVSPAESD
jgi:hypothetical protein